VGILNHVQDDRSFFCHSGLDPESQQKEERNQKPKIKNQSHQKE